MHAPRSLARKSVLAAAVVVLLAGLTACGNKESKPGQALASVNGEEITFLQLNEELQRAGVQAAQQEAASKQILESLIDRQLLLNEAAKEKLDRDPKVMQAIERAKALIIAQAYIQKLIGTPTKPGKAEVEEYYQKNPQFFANRKQLLMHQLVLATNSLTPEVKATIDNAKTLDEVAGWLDAHQVKYNRGQQARTTAELPPELSRQLLSMAKGQLFIIREGERSVLITIAEIKDAPVSPEAAAPQIEQYLLNKKNKDTADAEVKRLRAVAKIEYLNKAKAPAAASAPAASAAPAAASAAASAPASTPADDATARGVAGLK
ncbi:peptidyl-prolyl cis-trans isomerase, EpsD family [Duganella sp. FT135W]|uniref:peptidylprolyl isomerase n=2 Tax=Duganella flavida TaxID=2692175 RepID=A0A6L8KFT9_9BURK|nr:peptidyl-prolyl cis-trans isomerase, EpsD family [Duganella flavida]